MKKKHWLDFKKTQQMYPRNVQDVPFSDGEKASHPFLHKHHWGMTSSPSVPSFWCTTLAGSFHSLESFTLW